MSSSSWSCGACAPSQLIFLENYDPEGKDDEDFRENKEDDEFNDVDDDSDDDDRAQSDGKLTLLTRRVVEESSIHADAAVENDKNDEEGHFFEGLFECGGGGAACTGDDSILMHEELSTDDDEGEKGARRSVVTEHRVSRRRKSHSSFLRRPRNANEGEPIVPDANEFGFYPMPTREKGRVYIFASLARRQRRWREMVASHAIALEEKGDVQYSMWFRAHRHAPKIEHLLQRHDGKPTLNLNGEDIRRTIEALSRKEANILKAQWNNRGAAAHSLSTSQPIVHEIDLKKYVVKYETKLVTTSSPAAANKRYAAGANEGTDKGRELPKESSNVNDGEFVPTFAFGDNYTPMSFREMQKDKQMVGFSQQFISEEEEVHSIINTPMSRPSIALSFDDDPPSPSQNTTFSAAPTPRGGISSLNKKIEKQRRAWKNKRLPPFVQQALDIAEKQTVPKNIAVAYATCLGRIFLDPTLGEDSYAFAMVLRRVAKLQLSLGKYQAGVENLQLCLWIYEDNLGVDAVEVARVMNDYGVAVCAQFEMHLKDRNQKLAEFGESISIEQRDADIREAQYIYELAEDIYSRAAAILIAKGGTILHPQLQSIILNLCNIKQRLKNTSHYNLLRKLLDAALRDKVRANHSFIREESVRFVLPSFIKNSSINLPSFRAEAVVAMQKETITSNTVGYLEYTKSLHQYPHPQHGSHWQPIADMKRRDYLLRKERNDLLLSMAKSRGTSLKEKEKALLLSDEELRGQVSHYKEDEIEHIEPTIMQIVCPSRRKTKNTKGSGELILHSY